MIQVGDRVKIIKDDSEPWYIGEIGIVKSIAERIAGNSYKVEFRNKAIQWYNESDIQFYGIGETEVEKKFNKGDIVVPLETSNDEYGITNKRNRCVLEVVEVHSHSIRGKVISINKNHETHLGDCFGVLNEHLELQNKKINKAIRYKNIR